jgi:hypothetical protein
MLKKVLNRLNETHLEIIAIVGDSSSIIYKEKCLSHEFVE